MLLIPFYMQRNYFRRPTGEPRKKSKDIISDRYGIPAVYRLLRIPVISISSSVGILFFIGKWDEKTFHPHRKKRI